MCLAQCIVHWIHFQNIDTFTYQKTSIIHLLLKSSKAFRVSLRNIFIFISISISAQWLMYCYHAQWILTSAVIFSMYLISIVLFQKKTFSRFSDCRCSNETSHGSVNSKAEKLVLTIMNLLWTLTWRFFKSFHNIKEGRCFFQDSKNLRNKLYNVVLDLSI